MTVDPAKLQDFAHTLTDDQARLLREGLAEGGEIDADSLIETLNSYEGQAAFKELAGARFAAEAGPAPDAGVPDAGVPDGGVPDGGTSHPPQPEPPLTRW